MLALIFNCLIVTTMNHLTNLLIWMLLNSFINKKMKTQKNLNKFSHIFKFKIFPVVFMTVYLLSAKDKTMKNHLTTIFQNNRKFKKCFPKNL
jgi:hypothetical protein